MNVFLLIFHPQLVRTATHSSFPTKNGKTGTAASKITSSQKLVQRWKTMVIPPILTFHRAQNFLKTSSNSFSRYLTPYVTCLNPCIPGTGKGNGLAVSVFTGGWEDPPSTLAPHTSVCWASVSVEV